MPEYQSVLYQRATQNWAHLPPSTLAYHQASTSATSYVGGARRHPNLQPSQERKEGSAHASSQKLNSKAEDPMPPLTLTTTTTAPLTASVNKRSGGVCNRIAAPEAAPPGRTRLTARCFPVRLKTPQSDRPVSLGGLPPRRPQPASKVGGEGSE